MSAEARAASSPATTAHFPSVAVQARRPSSPGTQCPCAPHPSARFTPRLVDDACVIDSSTAPASTSSMVVRSQHSTAVWIQDHTIWIQDHAIWIHDHAIWIQGHAIWIQVHAISLAMHHRPLGVRRSSAGWIQAHALWLATHGRPPGARRAVLELVGRRPRPIGHSGSPEKIFSVFSGLPGGGAHLEGFEPPTFGSVDRRSIQLSYRCSGRVADATSAPSPPQPPLLRHPSAPSHPLLSPKEQHRQHVRIVPHVHRDRRPQPPGPFQHGGEDQSEPQVDHNPRGITVNRGKRHRA